MRERTHDAVSAAAWIGALLLAGLLTNVIAIKKAASAPRHSASTSCLPASIKAALARADKACGIRVISTLRRGATIAGTGGSPSKHAQCRAADFTTGRPSCVLSTLRNWPGKLSTDYHAVRHFHLDDGRYARFVHGGGRLARYARAQ